MKKILTLAISLLLSGCHGLEGLADLVEFKQETVNKPRQRIEPIPLFTPYEAFNYKAASFRSPFESTVVEVREVKVELASNIKPDPRRRKEYLEGFSLAQLRMMGSLQKADGIFYVLIRDGEGGIVRAKKGEYMGQNHGRIVSLDEHQVNLIEIVPNGMGGWVERPRTLTIDGLVGE